MPAVSAASLIDLVFAVRHSLLGADLGKPRVIFLSARTADPVTASAETIINATVENLFAMDVLTICALTSIGSLAGLAVICILPCFLSKCLKHNRARKTRCLGIDAPRNECHLGDVLEHGRVVDRARRAVPQVNAPWPATRTMGVWCGLRPRKQAAICSPVAVS